MPGLFVTMLLLVLGLAFYTLGAGVIEGLVNYRTWQWIGSDTFEAYHRAVGPRIVAWLVIPFSVGVLLTLGVAVWRPLTLPLWPILLSLAMDVVAIIATLGWQLPAQRSLDRAGWSEAVVARLIQIEWFRLVPHLVKALIFLWLAGRLIADAQGDMS